MKILYGVVGEGMGHAMRSRVVLTHLLRQGHEVSVMASGRAVEFLKKRLEDFDGATVQRIFGFFIVYEQNRVRRGKTAVANALESVASIPEQIASYFALIQNFKPDLVISDFESWTYVYAKMHNIPVLSIDNMQVMNRCVLNEADIEEDRADFQIAKAFVKAKLPFANHYLITSFAPLQVRKKNTTLVPPILRPEILAAKPSIGEHLLVYQTAEGNQTLLDALYATGLPCRVYGMKRELTADLQDRNLLFRPFSELGFIDDLASARGVIASAGFTLMGECVYLKKPMLAEPLAGQFEQILNAKLLARSGYGQFTHSLDTTAMTSFVAALPQYQAALATYSQDGNVALFAELDTLLLRADASLL